MRTGNVGVASEKPRRTARHAPSISISRSTDPLGVTLTGPRPASSERESGAVWRKVKHETAIDRARLASQEGSSTQGRRAKLVAADVQVGRAGTLACPRRSGPGSPESPSVKSVPLLRCSCALGEKVAQRNSGRRTIDDLPAESAVGCARVPQPVCGREPHRSARNMLWDLNARGESRTRTGLPPADFESAASAIPPLGPARGVWVPEGSSASAVEVAVSGCRVTPSRLTYLSSS